MKSEAEIRQSLRDWILTKNGKLSSADLRDDTLIIEQRIITSLQLMDLILQLERITGNPIDVEQLKPGVFKSIDAIYSNFCQTNSGTNSSANCQASANLEGNN